MKIFIVRYEKIWLYKRNLTYFNVRSSIRGNDNVGVNTGWEFFVEMVLENKAHGQQVSIFPFMASWQYRWIQKKNSSYFKLSRFFFPIINYYIIKEIIADQPRSLILINAYTTVQCSGELPISVTSLATGRSALDSCKSTTGLSVAASITSARISNKSMGNDGTRCVARTIGRPVNTGAGSGGFVRGTAVPSGLCIV